MVFLGAVLILSGGVKALDLNLFVRQIQSYGLLTHPQLTALAAWVVTSLECFLGAALLINYRPRQTVGLAFALLVAFTLLTLYALFKGGVEDCGCFGALVQRTPLQAVFEDGILLLLCLIAWKGAPVGSVKPVGVRGLAVFSVVVMAAIVPFYSGLPSALMRDGSPESAGIWTELQVEGIEGLDFGKDTHLVVLMSVECQHCQEAVPELAMLMDELQEQPLTVVGLGQDSLEDVRGFVAEWAPPYPIGRIESGIFWTLLAEAKLPRIFLVSGGGAVGVWDTVIPTADEILQLLPQ
jgi:uncharacterized membrane protein YphA (DoxX/SURF4 family)